MSEQPEALRIAYCFEGFAIDHTPNGWPAIRQQQLNEAAAELRRLHEVNQELLEALRWIANRCPVHLMEYPLRSIHKEMAHDAGACTRAAIAKGEQA